MRRRSISSIEKEIRNLKKVISPESICLTFIESTDDPCTFKIYETMYRSRADPVHKCREITAATMEEAAEQYSFPEGCDPDNSVLFMYDFGEWDEENEEL